MNIVTMLILFNLSALAIKGFYILYLFIYYFELGVPLLHWIEIVCVQHLLFVVSYQPTVYCS